MATTAATTVVTFETIEVAVEVTTRLDAADVVRDPRLHLARAGAREEGEREPLEVPVDGRAQVVHHRWPTTFESYVCAHAEDPRDDRDRDQAADEQRQEPVVVLGQRLVEDVADEERRDHAQQRRDEDSARTAAEPPAIGLEQARDAAEVRPPDGGVVRALGRLPAGRTCPGRHVPLRAAASRSSRYLAHAGLPSPRCRTTFSPSSTRGERVITEQPGQRPLGLARLLDRRRLARRGRLDRRRVALHRAPALQGLEPPYDAQEIAEIFDAPRRRAERSHLARAHDGLRARARRAPRDARVDLMADMVYAPTFADLDAEREVVLEEIAMYEDTPQELVHDLFSEAVFGAHPLGRPVIGTRRRDRVGRARRARVVPRRRCTSAATSSSRPPGTSSTTGCSSCSSRSFPPARTASARPVRPLLVKPPPPGFRFQRKDTEQYHVCVGAPGISRSDRRRFAASLLDAIVGGSASSRLFQEIREKRGMAYAVYSFASQYTDTGLDRRLRRDARGEPRRRASRSSRSRSPTSPPATCATAELERAKENLKGRILLSMESTSNRMSRLGRSLITDTELLTFERIIAEIEAVDADTVAELAAVLLGPGPALGRGHRPRRGAVPRRRRARRPGAPAVRSREVRSVAHAARFRRNRHTSVTFRAYATAGENRGQPGPGRRVGHGSGPRAAREVVLFGHGGKVGACSGRRSRRPGTSWWRSTPRRRRSTSPRPDAVVGNVRGALAAGVPCVSARAGSSPADVDALARERRRARSSTRRTSRSAPC